MKFLFILLLFGIVECIKVNNFCYQSSIDTNKKCNKKHSFKCSQITNLCSIDRYSCQSLTLFSKVKYRLVGPFRGGRSAAVAGSYVNNNTFYFGATGGGLWKTTDGGSNWKNLSDKKIGGNIFLKDQLC